MGAITGFLTWLVSQGKNMLKTKGLTLWHKVRMHKTITYKGIVMVKISPRQAMSASGTMYTIKDAEYVKE